jgi:hypothetical protein
MQATARRASRTPAGSPLRFVSALMGALALLIGLAACNQGATAPRATGDGPRLSFEERSRDFGQISRSKEMEYRWAFTNTGSAPLQISEIRTEPLDPTS